MKILIAGDYYPGYIDNANIIESALKSIKPLCLNVDYSIVNYESPISCEYDGPINKCGPCLKSNECAAEGLKNIGFNCVTLANNHVLDQGEKTLLHTIRSCKDIGFDIVGAGKDLSDADNVLYKEFDGKILAIINCCEHEFSVATDNKAGSNPLNPIQQFYSIQEARKIADHVLVIVHGGHEHFQLPSPRMQETYRFFIDVGADAVVNHHQHCYSGYEVYKGKPIFYGLGNFYFPKNKRMPKGWNFGFLVELNLQNSINFIIHPYEFEQYSNKIKLLDSKERFNKSLDELNSIISHPIKLKEEHIKWMQSTKKIYESVLLPYTNKFLVALWSRKLLTSFISKKKIERIINYVACESHRDRFLDLLNEKIDS